MCGRHRPSQKAREMDIAEEEEEEEEEPAPSRPAPRSHLSRYSLRAGYKTLTVHVCTQTTNQFDASKGVTENPLSDTLP